MENGWWAKHSTEMEQLSAQGISHAYYEAIKTVYGPQKSKKICQMFLKKDGLYPESTQESLERLAEHYSDLLTRNIIISSTTTDSNPLRNLEGRHEWNLTKILHLKNSIKPSKKRKAIKLELAIPLLRSSNTHLPIYYDIPINCTNIGQISNS